MYCNQIMEVPGDIEKGLLLRELGQQLGLPVKGIIGAGLSGLGLADIFRQCFAGARVVAQDKA